ncbi:hypothetical protein ACQB6R_13340 [Propionibacteriaceae bacterium G1746]
MSKFMYRLSVGGGEGRPVAACQQAAGAEQDGDPERGYAHEQ